MRAESAKVEAMRDSGALTKGLAAAKARSEARAEADAASDPLVTLLDDATPEPITGLTYGAAIRPKAWVTAHVMEAAGAVATLAEQATAGTEAFERYRAARRNTSAAPGRLLAASKCGQRRPKRGRR